MNYSIRQTGGRDAFGFPELMIVETGIPTIVEAVSKVRAMRQIGKVTFINTRFIYDDDRNLCVAWDSEDRTFIDYTLAEEYVKELKEPL